MSTNIVQVSTYYVLHSFKIFNEWFFHADLFTESRTLRKRRQTNSTVTVTERRRKPVTVSDILCQDSFEGFTLFICVMHTRLSALLLEQLYFLCIDTFLNILILLFVICSTQCLVCFHGICCSYSVWNLIVCHLWSAS